MTTLQHWLGNLLSGHSNEITIALTLAALGCLWFLVMALSPKRPRLQPLPAFTTSCFCWSALLILRHCLAVPNDPFILLLSVIGVMITTWLLSDLPRQ